MAAQKRFAEKQSFPFPLLADTGRELGLAYGACASESDGYANRISYVIGPDGKVLHRFPKVNPSAHPAEVLALL